MLKPQHQNAGVGVTWRAYQPEQKFLSSVAGTSGYSMAVSARRTYVRCDFMMLYNHTPYTAPSQPSSLVKRTLRSPDVKPMISFLPSIAKRPALSSMGRDEMKVGYRDNSVDIGSKEALVTLSRCDQMFSVGSVTGASSLAARDAGANLYKIIDHSFESFSEKVQPAVCPLFS
ncbi:uncharacterized protein K444DRAFT_193903 [Hyaloscypha bicolor E]|jgi:hypothetical protein|uniref:Uncharacterized protein n=1 Tax=Hyaloscypha bicolor E TaxID=1095630 RepID=A0A2J6SQ75_9HELO|nr:uncharacterized protein K444DRAFT_193903 [Hyaloscypha bicolor E]PMD52907.1 hypothetical protein K444DRAFT_193903 [Hyaloscypha bicolor E]